MLNKIAAYLRSASLRRRFKRCGNHVFFGRVSELQAPHCISIGDRCCFGDFLSLNAWPAAAETSGRTPEIVIGDHCNFGAMNHITCVNRITVGNHVLTGKWVTITDNAHGTTEPEELRKHPLDRAMFSKGEVVIQDDVWIGDGARILPGVTVGKGAVVGANAVVTRDVAPYTVVGGIPARDIAKKA